MRNNQMWSMEKGQLWLCRLFSLLSLYALLSCQTDSYDKGQGRYSLMQADLCELSVNGEKQGVSFVTDEGDAYELTRPVSAKWLQTPDTTYRTLLYYNKVADGQAEPMACGTVVTLHPVEHWRFKELPQDPIGFESAWLSRTGKYLNVGLLMKTGYVGEAELPHNIGLAQDTVYAHDDGGRTACYRLLHSQNGIPQYYTNRRYVSILLPTAQRPDTVRLTIETFDGATVRTIALH